MRRGIVLLSVLCFCISLAPFSQAQVFTVKDLGTLGGYYSFGAGVNVFGQVVGYSDTADHSAVHAFLWTERGGMQDLNPTGVAQSMGFGINNLGQVVGLALYPFNSHTQSRAFLWTKSNGMRDLGTLGNFSAAHGINTLGQVVGDTTAGQAGDLDPFLWTRSKGMQDLGTLGGGGGSAAAIDEFGRVVGGSFTGTEFHAFSRTTRGGMKDLGTLGGCESQAQGVNNLGQIVGGSNIVQGCASTVRHAFLWTEQKGMQDLGTPTGTSFGGPGAINLFGMVVGAACPQPCLSQESVHGYVWTRKTGWLDLNGLIPADSGWVIESVSAVNDLGQITGQGYINGQYHAFLLTPNLSRH